MSGIEDLINGIKHIGTVATGGVQDQKIADARGTINGLRDKQHADTTGVLAQMTDNDSDYTHKIKGVATDYNADVEHAKDRGDVVLQKAANEADQSLKDAKTQYSGTVEPRQKEIMETSRQRAGEAMTLKDRMDPNNSVHRANEAKYNTQADNEGRAGLANAGVLQALGAQNAATQLGAAGVPMTGGAMAAVYGQNQNAASQAYGATQRRMQALRDQGIERGYSENDKIYNEGVDATHDYAQRTKDYQQGGVNARGEQADIAKRRAGYGIDEVNLDATAAKDHANTLAGVAGVEHQMGHAGLTRTMGENARDTSARIEDQSGDIKRASGDKEQLFKTESGVLSALGGAAGGGGGGGLLGSLLGAGGAAAGLGGGGGDHGLGEQPADDTTTAGTGAANPEDINAVDQEMSGAQPDMSPESLDTGGGGVAGGMQGGDQNGGYYEPSSDGSPGTWHEQQPQEEDTQTAGFGLLGRNPYARRAA